LRQPDEDGSVAVEVRDREEAVRVRGEYVERVRIEAARRALAGGADPVEVIVRQCGFGTAETLRRAFHRRLGVAPSDYRDRFRSLKELS
jgi:transcriptional regulator GlxA family with amidase domain